MADGPACFPRGFTCPAVLGIRPGESTLSATGLLPPVAGLSRPLRLECSFVTPSWDVPQPRKASLPVWAPPRSLAATCGITFVFFSSGYLDVSVPLVCPPPAMDSPTDSRPLRRLGSPIRTSPDRSLLTAPRGSIGVRPVLLRLLAPRHPPCALSSLSFTLLQKLTRFLTRLLTSLSGFQGARSCFRHGWWSQAESNR